MKVFGFLALLLFFSCQTQGSKTETSGNQSRVNDILSQRLDTATFAGGCFWCIEASFEQIKGVYKAVSGYSGGNKGTADYRMVSSGLTSHAEAVQIHYDPEVISYETLLDIFFVAHDPTQLNRQGPDVGEQYRSEIFYHTEEQRTLASAKISELASNFSSSIVTRVSKLDAFYEAEAYHQDYERKHPNNGYIVNVSRPKIQKVAKKFASLLKNEE